jgi:polyhydroxybutyrate depolymerase
MRRNVFVLLFLLFAGITSAFAQETVTLEHLSRQREYHLIVPSSYDGETAVPLVIALHGAGGSGQSFMENSSYKDLAEEAGYVIVFPEGVQNSWGYLDRRDLAANDLYTNDWSFVDTLIDQISAEYNIDSERVYIIGFSNGGLLAMRIMCEYSSRLAGVAVIAAILNHFLAQQCLTADPVPLMLVLGTKDELFPWSGVTSRRQSNRLVITFSIQQTVSYFTTMNQCSLDSVKTGAINTSYSPVQVVETLFTSCRHNATFVLEALVEYDHRYPLEPFIKRDDDTTGTIEDAIWDFFVAHPGEPNA